MLPNAPKIPSCKFIWKRRMSCGPSRLYLAAQHYGKSGLFKPRAPRLGYGFRYSTDKAQGSVPTPPKGPAPCPKPQPGFEKTPPKKKSYGFGTTLAVFGVGTAAVVAYAKYDCDFRKYIEENAPWFNEFIKIATQEDNTYGESWDKFLKYVTGLFGSDQQSSVKGGDKKAPICPPPPKKEPYDAPKSAFQPLLDETPTPKKDALKYNEIRVQQPPSPELPKPPIVALEDTVRPPVITDSLPDFHPKTIVELEKHIGESAKLSISAYEKAVCALREHAESVYTLLETKIDRVDASFWNTLRQKTEAKNNLVRDAEKAAIQANERIQKLESILDDPAFGAPDSLKNQAKRNIFKIMKDIDKAKKELALERERTDVTDKYWQKVESARRHFQDEIEILFPSVKIDEKKLDIKPGELDLLLIHAYHHVLFYQKELAKLETLGELRVKQALEKEGDPSADNEKLIRARVSQELEKEKRELQKDLQRKLLTVRADQERDIKIQMKRQLEAAEDYLHDVMEAKEKESARKHQRVIDEKVETERHAYNTKLAEIIGRMKGVETSLLNRLKTDQLATQAQLLFACCHQLYRALRAGIPGSHWSKELRPLEAEISAIERAVGDDDPLVSAVLKGIPKEARSRGVFPEIAIRERFLKVENVARKLALVPDQGGSLPRYFLSYLQSFLLFRSVNPIPTSELDDQPVDISKLDTYDILERARYWLDRGDFGMALRYMNLLKGAARTVACDWMTETRIFLETQQAADALMAYAAATGQQYT